ncbi:Zn-dependent hydrolase [Falsochrobactrum sp. TDYN1]|uniref:Zn-dependent hydrolase n=1 Tax=Falsochrobactrum tianjinense TaxID=2706015 RepID=A0A949PQ43_9HYPH|nr:Zn-dependent hydrolase [Falsochrobactrum sp. TDYN1]MBV2144963.1 Zn-dependent hydrolase [Falsochrobactrum sp. TDYN1]
MITPRINADRLWQSLVDMAKIGPGVAGGNNRLAFSHEDDSARALLKDWCLAKGLNVKADQFGNMFATRAGTENLPPVMFGSHLDTQPTGGRFDGVLGVLAGLEILRTMSEAKIETRHPLTLVNWTNEEGAIFRPMMGSDVFTGALPLNEARQMVDHEGRQLGSLLDGLTQGVGDMKPGFPAKAYIELHIEQGPLLEAAGKTIGVVMAGIGFRRWLLTFTGQDAHAGPTPMEGRKDAMVAAAHAILIADGAAREVPGGRATCGRIASPNGSQVTVASKVELTLDLRHEALAQLDALQDRVLQEISAVAARLNVGFEVTKTTDSPPQPFDARIISAIETAARNDGFSYRSIVSGAGHDACNMACYVPSGMIFVPSVGGISHNEAEYTSPSDCAAGAQVLLGTVLAVAESSGTALTTQR